MSMRRRTEIVILAALALASAVVAFLLPPPPATGFVGRYWSNASWDGAPAVVLSKNTVPATRDIAERAPWSAGGVASAEWTGVLTLERAAACEFVVRSDDGAWLWIDDALVVDDGGTHGVAEATGRIDLASGPHRVRVRYFQAGGGMELAVRWTMAGGAPRPLDAASVAPDAQAAAARRARVGWRRFIVALPILWAALLLYLPVRVIAHLMWREVRRLAPDPSVRAGCAAVLVLAAGLMAWGIEWGARGDAWNPDELRPNVLREALAQRFSGGWHDKYPAMHFMVLGLPLSAFEFADRHASIAPDPLDAHTAQVIVTRLVSALMGLGALLAAFVCAAEMFGARRAAFAALALTLTPLFVFYGKVANLDMPVLCWFGWAMVGFLRVVRAGDRRAYVLLGGAAAAAVATKDQAYASLALLVPAVFLVTVRRTGGPSWMRRVAAACADPGLLSGAAAATAVSLVGHNVVCNYSGFVAHLRVLSSFSDIGIGPHTVGNAVALTWRTASLFPFAMGWPLVVAAAAGIVRASVVPGRRWWLWLLLVPLSFYVAFTLVTFYVCDRYLFPGVFVLALFAGSAMAEVFDLAGGRKTARSVVAAALAWSLLWAVSINVMMTVDARRVTRGWVIERDAATVGLLGNYVPVFASPVEGRTVTAEDDVARWRPEFVVVNDRYAWRYRARPDSREHGLLVGLESGRLGYAEVFRYRAPLPPWVLLQYDPIFRGPSESLWTNLDKVNPEMVVYRRTR